MNVCHEFSRCAHIYHEYSSIQKAVAQELIGLSAHKPKAILDLGCGDGLIYSCIDWEFDRFVGVDFAQTMLTHHPKNSHIDLRLGDFNTLELFDLLRAERYDRIYSSSSLQWSDDLGLTLERLSQLHTPVSLAIFTSGTFKTLYEHAHLPPILKSVKDILGLSSSLFDARTKILHYTLEFKNSREMFVYIKRSGVSGGKKMLSVSQIRQLMRDYPPPFVLEFEILLLSTH
jgi:malonyl-CoA O-methyltransferase